MVFDGSIAMIVESDFSKLRKIIERASTDASSSILVTVDGCDGAGKSTLADIICDRDGWIHRRCDDFLIEKNTGSYLNDLDFDGISDRVGMELEKNKVVLLDGICILEVTERACVAPDLRIYVRKTNDGFCQYEHFLSEFGNAEDWIAAQTQRSRMFAAFGDPDSSSCDHGLSEMKQELARDHFGYEPHRRADIVFNREASWESNPCLPPI